MGEGRRSRPPEQSGSVGPRGGTPGRRLSASATQVLGNLGAQQRPITLAALPESLSLHPDTVREQALASKTTIPPLVFCAPFCAGRVNNLRNTPGGVYVGTW